MSLGTPAVVTVTIRFLAPPSAIASSEPATSMSFGASSPTGNGLAVLGAAGGIRRTMFIDATQRFLSGPTTIGEGPAIDARNVFETEFFGSDGRKLATSFVPVTHIRPSGPAAIPSTLSSPSSYGFTSPLGVMRATLLAPSLIVTHMLPSGPATILLLVSTPLTGKVPLIAGAAAAPDAAASRAETTRTRVAANFTAAKD
jgi:hypothetical protein